jgi:hypothetical protein
MSGTKVGAALPWLLLVLVVVSGFWALGEASTISSAVAGSPEAVKHQTLTAYVLVPVFQASLTALLAGGAAKAIAGTFRGEIGETRFFNW